MTVKTEIPAFTGYQKLVIALVALLQFTVILDFMIISPLGDILMSELNMKTAQFGTVVSAYAFSAGASGILAAGFADKFDRKKLLLFFYTGFLIGTLCCALATDYWMLLIARIVTGCFGGVIGSITLAIVTDLFLPNQRGRVMGFITMAFGSSQILGVPMGIYLANHWGWHSAFLMVVALGIVLGIVLLVRLKPVDAHLKLQSERNALAHLWHTVQKRDYRIGFSTVALLSVGGFMLQPFGSAFMVNNVGIAREDLPLVFLAAGISVLVIMPVIGKLSDRFDKIKIFIGGTAITIVMCLIYTHLSVTPLWLVITVNVVMFMGIMSRIVPSQAINTAIPDQADRGAYMAITSSMQQVAGGFAAVVAGFIVYQPAEGKPLEHYPTLGYVVSGVSLLTIVLMIRLNRIAKKREPAIEPTAKP
ncbi:MULTISPECIES: MFS transporter [unclassified Flavobacterium]|uniref:MFS transporter n=1 Tax=unclassified Flavobacterium TaxID=196869 RepID=UPI001F13F4F6|nr:MULTISPECIES: MFS transporter [unclassified Flavobacterium]UMY64591.1 MFS transporter [Flavobacterium sp. HJ-32-4]